MAWTVPVGCYYAAREDTGNNYTWKYYSAGTSFADNDTRSPVASGCFWILIDFTNGYIYVNERTNDATVITIGNNAFTVSPVNDSGGFTRVNLIASAKALEVNNITLTGNAFTFGNGSGLLDKFFKSSYQYYMQYSFYGRNDITSVTVPNGVQNLYFAFASSTIASATISSSVTDMRFCFNNCASLVTAPTIPNTVTNMRACFQSCTSLTTAPTLPTNVTNIRYCFYGCSSLTTAPDIPASVTIAINCFENCTSLSGTVTINASPQEYTDMFTGTVNDLVLFGSGSLDIIAADYANVYVWSLSQTMTAQRGTSPATTVNVSVDVSRFIPGNLVSLNLYKDNGLTPLAVTWSDPTLDVTSNPTTFTTSITGIAESDSPLLTVIATDSYGSATPVSVKIPIAFYTMDVQAGGKEVAFGTLADDNLSSYPNGLFKCQMDAQFNGNITAVGDNTFTTGDTEIENPYFSLDTTASPGTTDGDLYAAIVALGWDSDVIV